MKKIVPGRIAGSFNGWPDGRSALFVAETPGKRTQITIGSTAKGTAGA